MAGEDDDADAILGIYQRHASAFDNLRSREVPERAWLDRFADQLSEGASVLDLGCGSGEPIAADFVARGFKLTGIDASPPLVDLCIQRFPDHEWLVADMRQLSLGRRFDGLVAWNSFFHLTPDAQVQMFPLFAEHAAPGAALLFTSGPSAGVALGSFEGEALYQASLAPAEYRDLLERHGFDLVHHIAEDPDCADATVWLARKR